MKWYSKLSIGFILAIIGYLIGNLIPIEYIKPKIISTDIETPEYYGILISSVSAIVTFLAVVVALFKEDIRRLWAYSNIVISIPDENFVEVLKTNVSDTSKDEQLLEAGEYKCNIQIKNSGNISALGVEIYLETLTFSSTAYPTSQIIETSGIPLDWNDVSENRINLPPEGNKRLCVIELKAPESQSLPSGENTYVPSKLFIAGIETSPDFKNGKWIGTFVIFSSNTKPIRIKLEIEWNGRWEKRVTEMKNHLNISLIN